MMNRIITFGRFEGRSFEWLFFNAPWYAHWLYWNRAIESRNDMDDEDKAVFEELCLRSIRMAGKCTKCKERPMVRMELGNLLGTTGVGRVGLFCDECYDEWCEISFMLPPSFFTVQHEVPRCAQKTVTQTFKDIYIGREGNLTQKRMEDFFRTDKFFHYATPNFFEDLEAGL